jgi:hypothetical protein
MWHWHNVHFGNKVSQIFMTIHDFCDTINFDVFWIYGTNICHGYQIFLCAMKFLKPWIHMHVYVY